jgi:hypothetical protein
VAMVGTLETLERRGVLTGFYLASGTALQRLDGFSLAARDAQTIHGEISGTKMSFLAYEYPVLFPQTSFLGVAVADPRDIACMKISAITSRGAAARLHRLVRGRATTRLVGSAAAVPPEVCPGELQPGSRAEVADVF